MSYKLVRSLLFALPPEAAHRVVFGGLDLVLRGPVAALWPRMPLAPRTVMGLEFPNAVGVAAGLDKNGDYVRLLQTLGFGFVEVGTVTPRPQAGHARPRLFRLPPAEALINRMGFSNRGVDYLVDQVRRRPFRSVLGINIGKNRDTPAEQAAEDYCSCLRKVYAYADYVAVNISSPNTPGLRDLQYGEALRGLLGAVKDEQSRLADEQGRYVPLVVKVAPDLDGIAIDTMAAAFEEHGIDGVAATNTTASRDEVQGLVHAQEAGGLSGRPLFERSTAVLRAFHEHLGGRVPLIGVGGILSVADAKAKIEAGASLVQIYSGLIYRGPGLVRELAEAL